MAKLNTGKVLYGEKSIGGNPLKILPLGDSITYGQLDPTGGYRDDLWRSLTQNGYKVDFVGNFQDGTADFDRDHAGKRGNRINEILGRLNTDSLIPTYQPNAVLLLAGTNDFSYSDDFANAHTRIGNIISKIQSQSPSTHVFVSSIPPIKDAPSQTEIIAYNNRLSNLVNSYSNATFVDAGNRLGFSDIGDDVHPTPEGYHKLADAWFESIQTRYANGGLTATYTDTLTNVENLIGSDYDDLLTGNGADNILVGGKGDDLLTGGGGADKFVLSLNSGFDTIRDFRIGEDKIALSGGLTLEQLLISSGSTFGYSSDDTIIAVSGSSSNDKLALLSNVNESLLNSNSFMTV